MSISKTSNRILLSSALAMALVAPLSMGPALADDTSLRFKTPAVCTTEGGSEVPIPPGRFLPEPVWLELKLDYIDLEDRTTRAEAENASYKASDEEGPGWKLSALILVVGIAIGGYTFGR